MAELVDALASGASVCIDVEVRVLSSAPSFCPNPHTHPHRPSQVRSGQARSGQVRSEKPKKTAPTCVDAALISFGAEERTRTSTPQGHQDLNLARLPIPPPRLGDLLYRLLFDQQATALKQGFNAWLTTGEVDVHLHGIQAAATRQNGIAEMITGGAI